MTVADAVPALLRRVELLEIAARRNVAALRSGDYSTTFRGSGLVFHESRKYVPGEPARRIDWNVTARLSEPYVRVHLEERQRDVFIALDVSPSMHAGSQQKTKLELGVELAATLAVSAIDAGDRVGHVLFADRALGNSRPRGGRVQLFRVLKALLEGCTPWQRPVAESDPRTAIHAVQRLRGRRFVVFLISDFVDHNVPEDLKYLQARHDVTLLHVYDPLELEPAADLVFRGATPEGEPFAAPLVAGETGGLEEMRRLLVEASGRHRCDFASISTAEPAAGALGRLFWRKSNRRAR